MCCGLCVGGATIGKGLTEENAHCVAPELRTCAVPTATVLPEQTALVRPVKPSVMVETTTDVVENCILFVWCEDAQANVVGLLGCYGAGSLVLKRRLSPSGKRSDKRGETN